jgi:hypothetical protein
MTDILPSESILYLEGRLSQRELKSFLNNKSIAEVSHIAYGSFWPKPTVYHIYATSENLYALAEIIEKSIIGSGVNHLQIYKSNKILLQGFEFGFKSIHISKQIPEGKIIDLCKQHSVYYIDVKWGFQYSGEYSILFKALIELLPPGTILYIAELILNNEWLPDGDLEVFIEQNSIKTNPILGYKKFKYYDIPATKENLLELSKLTERYHAPFEGFNFHVYKGNRLVLQQCKGETIYLSGEISKKQVKSFCQMLSLSYWELNE